MNGQKNKPKKPESTSTVNIFGYLRDNIKYNLYRNTIINSFDLSGKLATQLGFGNQVANIIHNNIIFVPPSGDVVKDASKIAEKIKESIWK